MTVPSEPRSAAATTLPPFTRRQAPTDPVSWAEALEPHLHDQQKYAQRFDAYYSGENMPPIVLQQYRESFGSAGNGDPNLPLPQSGVCAVGVDALADRLAVETFVVEGEAADGAATKAVNDAWIGSDMDMVAPMAVREHLIKSRVFTLVWPGEDGRAVISVEDPEQMVVHRQPGPPYNVDAALKVRRDEWTGGLRAMLWLPNLRCELVATADAPLVGASGRWRLAAEPEVHTLGLPVVEIANRARLLKPPKSHLERVAPLADIYNGLLANLVIAGWYGVDPIRWGSGLAPAKDENGNLLRDPNNGLPQLPFHPRADHFWASTNPETRFGVLEVAALGGYAQALGTLAELIRTHLHLPEQYFGAGALAGQSGETLRQNESDLVRAAMDRQRVLGWGWRRTLQNVLRIEGREPSPVTTRWLDPATREEATAVDSASKLHAMGVPLKTLLEHLGFDRQVVADALALRQTERMQDAAVEAALAAARTAA